jgi:hypothetical protein
MSFRAKGLNQPYAIMGPGSLVSVVTRVQMTSLFHAWREKALVARGIHFYDNFLSQMTLLCY